MQNSTQIELKKPMLLASVLVLLSIAVIGTRLVTTVRGSTTHHVYSGESIQDAINSAQSGDTIFVHKGTYYEHVIVDKSLSLIGENASTTIIDGSGTGTIIYVTANNTNISHFTIRNSGPDYPDKGIHAKLSNGHNISNNIITNNNFGIWLSSSSDNIISGNDITASNSAGIVYMDANYNNISGNNITNNFNGFNGGSGSSSNVISGNNITANSGTGILTSSSSNTISGNNITNNGGGVWLSGSNNTISGNSITENNWCGIARARECNSAIKQRYSRIKKLDSCI